jgi:hypothetical protein
MFHSPNVPRQPARPFPLSFLYKSPWTVGLDNLHHRHKAAHAEASRLRHEKRSQIPFGDLFHKFVQNRPRPAAMPQVAIPTTTRIFRSSLFPSRIFTLDCILSFIALSFAIDFITLHSV